MSDLKQLKEDICKKLIEYQVIKFGDFTLKSGKQSNVYFDLRLLCSHPDLLDQVTECYHREIQINTQLNPDLVCGVAYTGIPLATAYSLKTRIPMIFRRKEAKNYGLKKTLEGTYQPNQHLVLLDDVITSGTSIFETLPDLLSNQLKIDHICVLIDRRPKEQQTNYLEFENQRFSFSSIFIADEIFTTLYQLKYSIPESLVPQNHSLKERLTYIMNVKKTNLILSADVTKIVELFSLITKVHEHICILKLHSDVLTDATLKNFKMLKTLSKDYNFLLMEDRKFADIGNTCNLQYTNGPHQIISWADLVTFQTTMGPSTIQGLNNAIDLFQSYMPTRPRGLVPIIEASTPGNLLKTQEGLDLIQQPDLNRHITAIVAQERPQNLDKNILVMTPGVNLNTNQDTLGQKYRTPEDAILKQNCDLIIVGRGIYQAENPKEQAQAYQKAGWEARMQCLS